MFDSFMLTVQEFRRKPKLFSTIFNATVSGLLKGNMGRKKRLCNFASGLPVQKE